MPPFDDEKHTDVSLQEMASQAYDELAADVPVDPPAVMEGAADPAAAAAAKPAGEAKPATAAEPADGKPAAAKDSNRDEQGRFKKGGTEGAIERARAALKANVDAAAAAAGEGAEPKVVDPKAAAPAAAQQQHQVDTTKAAPPPGWSIAAKAQWDKLPAEVRADIAKREAEVSAGFSEYAGVKPYVERAKAAGQTLGQALEAYTGIEDLFRRDIGAGFMHVAQNAGLTQHQAAQAFAQLAQRLGFQGFNGHAPGNQNAPGGSPADQNAGADPVALQQLLAPVVTPLTQRLHQLESLLNRQAEADRSQRMSTVAGVVEQFRQDPANKFYDNLESTIGDLLEGGVVKRTGNFAADLKSAYELACRMHPEVSEVLINERIAKTQEQRLRDANEATTRARAASRSIHGAPAPGAKQSKSTGKGGDSLRAAAEAAYDSATV